LKKKKVKPKEFDALELVSKGFLDEITIQDFPLRGKFVYLHIKRRRWTNKTTGEIIQRDWQLVAKGTRMTQEFAAFLRKLIDNTPINCHVIGGFLVLMVKNCKDNKKTS
jgi:hypothetical protein